MRGDSKKVIHWLSSPCGFKENQKLRRPLRLTRQFWSLAAALDATTALMDGLREEISTVF